MKCCGCGKVVEGQGDSIRIWTAVSVHGEPQEAIANVCLECAKRTFVPAGVDLNRAGSAASSDSKSIRERFHPSIPGWRVVDEKQDGVAWANEGRRLSLICSANVELDGDTWLHVSLAHPKRMPTYEEMAFVKRHWIGDDLKALMIFPRKSEHVNIHPYCLHLWASLGDDGLPEFSWNTGSI